MTKQEAVRRVRQADQLRGRGFTPEECDQLRRISNTLQRWFELECGDSNEYASWAIERDGDEDDSVPYMVRHVYGHGRGPDRTIRTRIADRETGARRRLAGILADRNVRARRVGIDNVKTDFTAYIQTDPRGAALYIIRPGDVPEGEAVSGYYTRGICVY